MLDAAGFFSDPKVVISLLALGVSIVALSWSFFNQYDQNRRWNAVNAANVVLREAKMLTWEKISQSEASLRNWGYQPEMFNGELKDEVLLLSAIKLSDLKSNEPIVGASTLSTVEEAVMEAERLGLFRKVSLTKSLRPFFQFENLGKTTAYKTNLTVYILEVVSPLKEWRKAFESNSRPDLGPGQQTSFYIDIGLPGDLKVQKLSFRIEVEFEDTNRLKRSTKIMVSWDGKVNYWHYSTAETDEDH